MKPLQGKIALVIGASRGIGAATAQRLAAEGAEVICTGRTLDDSIEHIPGTLQEVVAKIESRGGRAHALRCDVADPASRRALMAEVDKRFDRIDILVNNAAGSVFKPIDQVTDDNLHWQFELNVYGPFDFCRWVAPGMRSRGWGRIVNISSAQAKMPEGPPFLPNDRHFGPMVYGMTKVALNRLTAGLAAELEETGVAVNGVAPVSAVYTEGVAAMMERSYGQELRKSPLWKEEPVEAMAEAALALCLVDPSVTSGRTVYSLEYLAEIGRVVHTLDGSRPLAQ